MADCREGVGVERTIAGREAGYDIPYTGVGGGWPSRGANLPPEMIVVAQRKQLTGSAASGGEGGAIEPVQYVGSNDIRMDRGDRWFSTEISGGGG